uniref:Hedgehog-interacting protein n=1 Tax=Scleropages formosus TaxID=113540 RepID=A0A8C9STJ8_SCLFO
MRLLLLQLALALALAAAAAVAVANLSTPGREAELPPRRRRRCADGGAPRRLRNRARGSPTPGLCHGLYPRASCCPSSGASPSVAKIFSSNDTRCSKFLEEIGCARCSPHSQALFRTSRVADILPGRPFLPRLCQDYCARFYYTCGAHLPGNKLFQADVDEFCQYYGGREHSLCFPDFHRKQTRGPTSNYLDLMEDYENKEDVKRKQKPNCYCALEVVSGLRQPAGAVHCGDGSQRLFILEKEGFVRILTASMELLKEPFLDIHKLVQSGTKGADERGLLSLAFHPGYKANGKLYVSYTTNPERWAAGPHDHILRVVEYTVSRKDPNQVDPRTSHILMEVAELHRKHLGGQLLFGPDGLLHVFLGDGMITLDDMEEMDGLSDFTGAVLRVDVDTDSCNTPYTIPRNNPYFNSTNQPPELFAHGLHDPGRCAVDRHYMDGNGSLLIICTDSRGRNSTTGRILQILKGEDYEHAPAVFELPPSSAPPVGGFVYRGCQSRRLYGSYVFGDRGGNLQLLQRHWVGHSWHEKPLCLGSGRSCSSTLVGQLLGFGEDELGEVYVLATSKTAAQSDSGKLYKLMDPKRPLFPKECQRPAEPPELLGAVCARHCKNGRCTPTGACCCGSGWHGPFCRTAKCEPGCRNGGVCVEPNKCLCKSSFSGAFCEKDERGVELRARDGLLDQIIDMTSYLLDLTSYIV